LKNRHQFLIVMDMELRLLKSFQALAEAEHFGRAAKTIHISQPALTKQVRQLEAEVGGPLFVRGRQGAQLTPLGRLFAGEVAPLLRHADRVLDRVRRASRGELGELRLGFGIATRLLVPRLVSRFRRAFPEVQVSLQDTSTPIQLEALASGTLDVGFVRLPIEAPLVHIPVVEERLVLAVPETRAAELARRSPTTFADEPFVELGVTRSPSFHAHVLRVCAAYGFRPTVAQSATEFFTVLALVAARMGIAVVPRAVTETRVEGVAYLPLDVPEAAWHVGAAWLPAVTSPAREAFLTLLREHLARAAARGRGAREPGSR
jgi:DNA-binding transcriptional LysR family regulator